MLLVIPATVPAFASGDGGAAATPAATGPSDAVSAPDQSQPAQSEPAQSQPADPAPAPDPAPAAASSAPASSSSSASSAAPKSDPKPAATRRDAAPTKDAVNTDAANPVADDPTDATGATGDTGSTGATGSTGSTGPSGPVAGGGVVDTPGGDSGSSGNQGGGSGAPATGDGTQPSTTSQPSSAPRSTGTLTSGRSGAGTTGGDGSGSSTAQPSGSGTTASQVGAFNAAAGSGGVDRAAHDVAQHIAGNADSGVVASLIVTRLVNQIPAWVFWALGALGVVALAGLGLFWRERSRRRSAEQEAMFDELTGISNRKAFDRRLDLEYRRAARYGRSLGLMVMDLDGFKQVNDVKGHAAGDRVLREVAQALDARMRDTDLVARIGGDEFAVICPETGINELMTIRRQLAEQVTKGMKDQVGLSVGVAEYVPGDDDATSILARADESMYRVKRGETLGVPA